MKFITVIGFVGFLIGGYFGYKVFRKFTWFGTMQGLFNKAFTFIIVGGVIGMIPAAFLFQALGLDSNQPDENYIKSIIENTENDNVDNVYHSNVNNDDMAIESPSLHDNGYDLDLSEVTELEPNDYSVYSDTYENDLSEYILPYSNSEYLSESDLSELDADSLRLARNEIYARHGRLFDDTVLQNYFSSKSWYHGYIAPSDFQENTLNDYEIYNRDFIVQYEKNMGFRWKE